MDFIAGLTLESCRPASARMIGTPALQQGVELAREQQDVDVQDLGREQTEAAPRVLLALLCTSRRRLDLERVTPLPNSRSATAAAVAPSSTPLTTSPAPLRPR